MNFLSTSRLQFEQYANPADMEPMAQYMRNQFSFLGLKAPIRRKLQTEILKEFPIKNVIELRETVQTLWSQEEREFQYFALDLLDKRKKLWDEEMLPLMEEMILDRSWWDTVDLIAGKLLGYYFQRFPEGKQEFANKCLFHDDFWMNRTGILFQLKYKEKTDTQLLTQHILRHKDSDEFFLQKAIGWVLREYGKTNPDFVLGFVKEYELKPLSRREALKHLK